MKPSSLEIRRQCGSPSGKVARLTPRLRLSRFSGLHLSDYSPHQSALRRRYLCNGYAATHQERVERMHLFWSVWTMDCCTILVWQRLSAFDDQTDFPLVVNEVRAKV